MAKKIYVIAGEASGDLHGANLIRALREESSEPLEIYGVGGERIRETGALNFVDLAHFHVTGFSEAIRRMPKYWAASKKILDGVRAARPDTVVLIDNPGFNLHLAEKIHSLGIPIVYYIAPQVWAWAPKRILKIKKCVRKVLVVFEFEKKIYEENGVCVAWVGHPLKDLIGVSEKTIEIMENSPRVLLLPGSRKGELKHLLASFLEAAALIKKKLPGTSFDLLKSPSLPQGFYERLLSRAPVPVRLVEDNPYEVMKTSDLAIACSGTATLECALLGTPMIIANKGSLLTWAAAKALIRVPYLGLPNLVLQDGRFPELLQFKMTPRNLAAEAIKIVTDRKIRERMKEDLREVSRKLGDPGAGRRAAAEILKI